MVRAETTSTFTPFGASGTIAHEEMSDSLLGAIIGSTGAALAFIMRLVLGNARSETRLLIMRHHGELKEQIEQEFRSLEHRLTRLETEISRDGQ